jgi:PAS domain S-box-containing protein
MKDKLKQQEHYFSTIVENSTDIIARYDTDLGYIYCNKAVEIVIGIPIKSLIGKTPQGLIFYNYQENNYYSNLLLK